MSGSHTIAVDAGVTYAIIASWLGWFQPIVGGIALLAGLIWYTIQIWESRTVQRRLRWWRIEHRKARLVKLRAAAIKATAKVVATNVEAAAAVVAEKVIATAVTDKVTSEAQAIKSGEHNDPGSAA